MTTATAGVPASPLVDHTRWPDLAVSRAKVRGAVEVRVARQLFRAAASRLPVRIDLGGGTLVGGAAHDESAPLMLVHRPEAFFAALGAKGLIGFGESYMAGDWEAPDLAGLLEVFAAQMATLIPAPLQKLRAVYVARHPQTERNTTDNTRDNIARHYDLSNDLFALFLDETMTYSSAVYSADPANSQDTLADAQRRKIDRLLDRAGVGEGTRLLEIGTGWGELSIRAAARGARVTTITISTEQATLARQRIDAAGLADRIAVELRDYREVSERFDAVVSVEMIEAVGANHWDEYFTAIDRVLVQGGRVGLQAILQDDRTVQATKDTYTWIRKYIFPGGQCASLEAIQRTLAAHTALTITDRFSFNQHYAETLRRWRTRFEERAAEVDALGFDETFRRMWSFYLAYSEAGFRAGYLDVQQITLVKR